MDKLVSRIPPPPRVPKVEGVSRLAPTVSDRPPPDDGTSQPPRWRKNQLARSREIAHASGAVIAALLLGALIAWASSR
jgi:hypothetical protein